MRGCGDRYVFWGRTGEKRLPLGNSRLDGILLQTSMLQRGSGEAGGPRGSPTLCGAAIEKASILQKWHCRG